jgi:hypothetical protein
MSGRTPAKIEVDARTGNEKQELNECSFPAEAVTYPAASKPFPNPP